MITRSMKRIVLSIIDASREVGDAWKRASRDKSIQNRMEFNKAMDRLEKAVKRLDRIEDARAKTD